MNKKLLVASALIAMLTLVSCGKEETTVDVVTPENEVNIEVTPGNDEIVPVEGSDVEVTPVTPTIDVQVTPENEVTPTPSNDEIVPVEGISE